MKTVRMLSVVIAAALLITAFVSFAAKPAAQAVSAAIASPVQAFTDAAQGLTLLAPMSMTAPLISVKVDANTSSSYGCTYVKQTPLDWTKMRSRQDFDAAWTVKNSGSAVWNAKSTKLTYIAGTKMQTKKSEYALTSTVGKGKTVKLIADMEAPKAKGTYSTLWALYAGNTRFCNVTLTITVVR